jgi:hypothetical protein
MIAFIKEYVGLVLLVTVILYLLPSEQYRRYLRFFLELVLVLFLVQRILSLGNDSFLQSWEGSWKEFLAVMEQRRQEAEDMEFLEPDYVEKFTDS